MDRATIEAVENHLKLGLPTEAEAILLIEVDGRHTVVDEDAARVEAICREHGATQVERAGTDTERDRLWKARRSISPALGRIRSGKINEDVTVPRTRIPELIRTIRDLAARYDLVIVNFGHAGDGNIHTNIMVDRKDADELRRAERAVEELFRAVIDLGGTLSGEHGIGITKSPFLQWEVDEGAFEAMWRIKRALDPANILNPGKMFVPNRAFFAKGS
jgi:glycolate oxidase